MKDYLEFDLTAQFRAAQRRRDFIKWQRAFWLGAAFGILVPYLLLLLLI